MVGLRESGVMERVYLNSDKRLLVYEDFVWLSTYKLLRCDFKSNSHVDYSLGVL